MLAREAPHRVGPRQPGGRVVPQGQAVLRELQVKAYFSGVDPLTRWSVRCPCGVFCTSRNSAWLPGVVFTDWI